MRDWAIRTSGSSVMPAGSKRMFVNFDEGLQRHAVLQRDRSDDREGIHDTGERGAPLPELQEDLTEATVVVGAGREVAPGAADLEGRGLRGARFGRRSRVGR